MKNIFYFPFFKERGDLNDQLARASWYLSCLNPAKVYFPVDLEDAAAFRFEVPRYLEKGLTSIFEPFWRKIVLLNVKEEKALIDSFNRSTIIMQWKKNEYPSYLWEKKIDQEKITKQLWRVDRFNERFEGSFYIKVGIERQNYPQLEKDLEENKQKFMNMAKEIGSVRRAYIFGTGPTIAQYKEFDYSDGLTIICNSIIFDPEILKYIKPKILTFGDPIFHFGISRYASTFRKKLTGVLKEHKMYLLIPFNYYRLFTYHFPQYKDITIAIPFKYGSFINLNLIDQFYLYPAGNVLTLLMLPIACTFADEISILGSDGRKKIDDSYFWTHNPGTQINDKMENIKEAHPSFFNIDYNEYYDGHIELLEAYLTALEKMKKIYRTLTPSYIPVLRKRYEYRNKAYEKDFYPLVSIIMPIYSYKARSAGSIETAAASVAHQNYKNWELIIVVMVNEAESNNMNEKAAELINRLDKNEKEARVKIKVFQTKAKGVDARNVGIRYANGEYVAFQDPGDRRLAKFLEQGMETLITNGYEAVFLSPSNLKKKKMDDYDINHFILSKKRIVEVGKSDENQSNCKDKERDRDLIEKLMQAGVIFGSLEKTSRFISKFRHLKYKNLFQSFFKKFKSKIKRYIKYLFILIVKEG